MSFYPQAIQNNFWNIWLSILLYPRYSPAAARVITVGVTAVSAVTPTVIVALSAQHALSPAVIDSDSKQSLQEEEERP